MIAVKLVNAGFRGHDGHLVDLAGLDGQANAAEVRNREAVDPVEGREVEDHRNTGLDPDLARRVFKSLCGYLDDLGLARLAG